MINNPVVNQAICFVIAILLLGFVFWVLYQVMLLSDNTDEENQDMGLKLH